MTTQRRDGRAEEPWRAWIRANKRLESVAEGMAVTDSDLWVHRYKVKLDTCGSRELQHIMLTEWKTHGKQVADSQADTYRVIDAFLRSGKRFRKLHIPSQYGGGVRRVRCWGVHTVTLSGESPATSSIILWDGKPVDVQTLEELLRFERNPDTLTERSDRRHHCPAVSVKLQTKLEYGGE